MVGLGFLRWLRARVGRAAVHTTTVALPGGVRVRVGVAAPPPEATACALVLCLHHAWDTTKPVPRGLGARLLEALFEPGLRDLRAVLVAPDCPGARWSDPDVEAALLSLIAELRQRHRLAGDGVVLAGVSDGATAAWSFTCRHPAMVAAAVVIAGSPPPAWRAESSAPPIFAVHGRDDEVMPLAAVRTAIGLLRAHGVQADLQVVEGSAHDDLAAFVDPLRALVAPLRAIVSDRPRAGAPSAPERG